MGSEMCIRDRLKRNAFIIAASGLYLANAGAADVPTLLAEVEGRGAERLGNDLRAAMAEVAGAAPGHRAEAYKTASFILDAAEMREQRAVASITDFVEGDRGMADAVTAAGERVGDEVDALRARLGGYYRSITGDGPPRTRLTAAEQAAAETVPVNLDDVDEYLSNRPRLATGLTSLMTFSTWGHVDGVSSYLDIFKQVMAEAKVHGAWYYGSVELDQVTRTLEAGVEAGVLRLR